MEKKADAMSIKKAKLICYFTDVFSKVKDAAYIKKATSGGDACIVMNEAMEPIYFLKIFDGTNVEKLKKALREVDILKQLDHKNVIKVIDMGKMEEEENIRIEILLEYAGQSLSKMLDQGLSIDLIVKVAEQTAEALKYIHSKNIFHCDIKPENIVIKDGLAKIIDFDVSLEFKEHCKLDKTTFYRESKILGYTPQYQPPEILKEASYVREKVDVYCWGMTMLNLMFPSVYRQICANIQEFIESKEAYKGFTDQLELLRMKGVSWPKISKLHKFFNLCLNYEHVLRPKFSEIKDKWLPIFYELRESVIAVELFSKCNEKKVLKIFNSIEKEILEKLLSTKMEEYNAISISGAALTPTVVETLRNTLKTNPHIRGFKLFGNEMSPSVSSEIENIIRESKSLLTLAIFSLSYLVECIKGIADAIKENKSLISLFLLCPNKSNDEISYILNAIQLSASISSLNLCFDELSYSNAQKIAETVENNTNISSLGLHANSLSDEALGLISNSIITNRNISELTLFCSELSEKVACAIVHATKAGNLKAISVFADKMADLGTQLILAEIEKNKHLSSFALKIVDPSDLTETLLAEVIKKNRNLVSVSIMLSGKSSTCSGKIAEALSYKDEIRSFLLVTGDMTEPDAHKIIEKVKNRPNISSFILYDHLFPEGFINSALSKLSERKESNKFRLTIGSEKLKIIGRQTIIKNYEHTFEKLEIIINRYEMVLRFLYPENYEEIIYLLNHQSQ